MKHGWEYKKFIDICNVQYGYAFDSKCFTNNSEYPPLIRIRDVQRGYSETYYNGTIPEGYTIFEGDYLVGMDGEFNIGQWGKRPGLLNQRVCKIKPASTKILDRYMYYFMKVCLKSIEDETPFVTVKHLSAKRINQIQIPLPPKSTQLAIVSELDKINELIRLKKEQLKDFDNLAQSIFYEMFGDPVENEMGWEVKKLGDSIKVIGGYAFCSKNFLKSGIPVLRIGNINTGKFTPTNMVYWQKDKGLSRYRILPGDLVISLTGTVGKSDYGNVCILGNDYEEYYLNQRNAKLEVGSNLNKYFLTYLLKQDMIRKKLTGINRGVRQANIANRDIENLNIPLPPLPLQHLFAQRIEQIEHQKAEVQKAIADLETLLASRMQYWFE